MCKFFCIRRKKGKLYKFCKLHKQTILTCADCEDKEYKTYKRHKRHKHKMTQATEIQEGVKEAVWENYVDKFFANAHFIPRSQRRSWN